MSHVLFVTEVKSTVDEGILALLGQLKKKLELATGIGLKGQEVLIQQDISATEAKGRISNTPLTAAEIVVWKEWLPTVYSDIDVKDHKKLEDYAYDSIPHPVFELWNTHKKSGLFQRFEIWTPEGDPDPILVGIVGKLTYLLARWNESDASLLSFEDIKRRIELKRRKGQWPHALVMYVPPAALLAYTLLFFFSWVQPIYNPLHQLIAWIVLSLVLLGILSWWAVRRYRRNDHVLRAILQHDQSLV